MDANLAHTKNVIGRTKFSLNPGVSEEKSEALDVDEDGTIYGDKPILKTPEERAATKPVHGWKDPWRQRVRAHRR